MDTAYGFPFLICIVNTLIACDWWTGSQIHQGRETSSSVLKTYTVHQLPNTVCRMKRLEKAIVVAMVTASCLLICTVVACGLTLVIGE